MSNEISSASSINNTPQTDTPSSPKPPSNVNGTFVATGGAVVVTVKPSDSGYKNKIYWSTDNFNTIHYITVDNYVGDYTIGVFDEGTVIEFGINNGAGAFFRTGAVASDGIAHAKVTKSATTTEIGFEDVYGGGDYDFNDALISVWNRPNTPAPSGGGGGGFSLNLNKPVTGTQGTNGIIWPWQLIPQNGYVINGGNSSNNTFDLNAIFKNLNNYLSVASNNSSVLKMSGLLDTQKTQVKESSTVTPKEKEDTTNKITYDNFPELNLTVKKINEPDFEENTLINPVDVAIPEEPIDLSPEQVDSAANAHINTNFQITNGANNEKSNASENSTANNQGANDASTASTTDVKLLNAIYNSIG